MNIKLEDREYSIKANGAFIKKYQKNFPKNNCVVDINKALINRDMLLMQQIIYCAIENIDTDDLNNPLSFDEWLGSFETAFFVAFVFDDVAAYITRATKPSAELKEDSKKK